MSTCFRTKYAQYKRDTVQISTWLAETAIRHGYTLASARHSNVPLDGDQTGLTAEQRRNARKKERRKQREANAAAAETEEVGAVVEDTPGPAAGDYLLQVSEFSQIARHLKKAGAKVPDALFRLIRRCVKNRRSVSDGYQPDSAGSSHEHFVCVLEEVESILSELKEGERQQTETVRIKIFSSVAGGKGGDEKTTMGIVNRFESLGIAPADQDREETGHDGDDEYEEVVLPEPQGPSEVVTRWHGPKRLFAPLLTKLDGLYTVLAYLNDVYTMRQHLKEVWVSYAQGKIDLVTASVTTNTALETLQEGNQDIMDQVLPLFDGNLGLMLGTLLVALESKYLPRVRHARLLEPHEKSLQKHYEFLLIPNWQIINQAETFIHPEYIDLYDYDQDRNFDPSFATAGLTFGKYWEQAEILIHDSYLQYWTAIRAGACMMGDLKEIMGDKDNMVYVDEMARQLGTFMHTKRLSILILAHSQVYIDIYSALGPKASRGREQMKKEVAEMISTIERDYVTDLSYAARPGDRGPPKINKSDKRVRLNNDLLEHRVMANRDTMRYWAQRDPIKEEKLDVIRKLGLRSRERASHYFLDRSPMFCGLLLFRFRLRFRDTSLDLVNRYAHIMAAAHLYIAAKLHVDSAESAPSAPRLQAWPIMDSIVEMHGKEDICAGRTPQTILELLDCVMETYGSRKELRDTLQLLSSGQASSAQLAKIAEGTSDEQSTKTHLLRDRTQVLPIFSDRYLRGLRPAANLDVLRVDALIRELNNNTASNQPRHSDKDAPDPSSAPSRKLSVFEMLNIIQRGLAHEKPLLRFNYLDVQHQAHDLLKAVREDVPAAADAMRGKTDDMLKVVPGALLQQYWTLETATHGSSSKADVARHKEARLLEGVVLAINRRVATWQISA